jgi:hypothetical protein
MSNRKHLEQVKDKHHTEADPTETLTPHEHHQPSLGEVARGQSMVSRARSGQATTLAAQANTMRLKKGNAARHG